MDLDTKQKKKFKTTKNKNKLINKEKSETL